MRSRTIRGLLVATALLAIGPVSPDPSHTAIAQEAGRSSSLSDAELDDLAAQVASELRCPVCRNQAVGESSAELSREMQAVIRERLAAGDTPEQVKDYFVARYGEWILLKPEARGANLLVYVLPVLTFLIGGLIVWRLLKRWSGGSAGRPAAIVTVGGTASDAEGASELGQEAPEAASAEAAPAAGDPKAQLSERDEAWLERAVSEG